MLEADGAGGHHNVAGLHVQVDAAAGAGADKGVRAAFVELLHSDGGGGAADAGGAGRDLFSQKGAGPDVELPVVGHLVGVLKQRGDGGHPARVSGQDAVPAYVLRGTADMKLFFKLLHEIHRSFLFHRLTAALPVFLGKAGLPLWQMMLRNSIADSPPDCKGGGGENRKFLPERKIREFKLTNLN